MQQQIVNQWLNGVLQSLALSDALQAFHAATDKELASMAAYKALGLNPSDAPKFGWNLSERPGTRIVTTNIDTASRDRSATTEAKASTGVDSECRSALRRLRAALLAAGLLLTGAGGAAGLIWLTQPGGRAGPAKA